MSTDVREIIGSQIDLAKLSSKYFRPKIDVLSGQGVGAYVVQDGQEVLHLTSLDYLSLATDNRIIEAAIDAARIYGIGSLASPLVSGTLDIHLDLRRELADYMAAEGSCVFSSGMLTNIGCIPAIIDSQFRHVVNRPERATRAIFADEYDHACIKIASEAVKSHGVEIWKYRHCDAEHLELLMTKHCCDLNLIITDAFFSMEGDLAPLQQIVDIAKSFRAENRHVAVYTDDSHGVGVLGSNGRGTCELLGVENEVVRMGVISKAFGTMGGFVTGDKWLMDYLSYSTTQMFSMGVPPMIAAATIEALRIARQEPWRRETLLKHASYLRGNLRTMGYEVLGEHHVVSVIIGDEEESTRAADMLKGAGILCPEIKFPAVPMGRARLRVTPVCGHTKEDLDRFLDVMSAYKSITPAK